MESDVHVKLSKSLLRRVDAVVAKFERQGLRTSRGIVIRYLIARGLKDA